MVQSNIDILLNGPIVEKTVIRPRIVRPFVTPLIEDEQQEVDPYIIDSSAYEPISKFVSRLKTIGSKVDAVDDDEYDYVEGFFTNPDDILNNFDDNHQIIPNVSTKPSQIKASQTSNQAKRSEAEKDVLEDISEEV